LNAIYKPHISGAIEQTKLKGNLKGWKENGMRDT
jgi:hypothetical protein